MKKRGESGFALLLVLLMAAVIAITLYMQIPRVAFEAQRQKEQLLIERGEQYQRAIELFFRANNRYPARIEDLESFNNRRFLRHKFLDPMTGKDEWRLIHINSAGVLSDSLVQKKKTDAKQEASTAGQYVGEQAAIGSTLPGAQAAGPNALTRRRTSEGGANPGQVGPDGQPLPGGVIQQTTGIAPLPGGQQFPGGQVQYNPGQPQPYTAGQPYPGQQQLATGQPYPGQQPFVTGQPYPGNAGNNPGTVMPPEVANMPQTGGNVQPPGFPGQVIQGRAGLITPYPGGQAIPGQAIPGQPGQVTPGTANPAYVGGGQAYVGGSQPYVGGGAYIGAQPAVAGTGAIQGQINPAAPGFQPNYPTPGGGLQPIQPTQPTPNQGQGQTPFFPAQGAGGQNPATQIIQQILQNPRPTGAAGTPGQPVGQQIGGGIAGVASKSENPSIMVFNDHTQYNEWEFTFDYSKPKGVIASGPGAVGTPAQNLGSTPGAAPADAANGGGNFGPGSLGNSAPNAPGGPGTPAFGQNSPVPQGVQMPPTTDPTLRMGRP